MVYYLRDFWTYGIFSGNVTAFVLAVSAIGFSVPVCPSLIVSRFAN